MLADAEVEIARLPLDHLGGRVEGRSRRGRAGRGVDRQALLERGARARRSTPPCRSTAATACSKEFPLERWYREARVRRIGEGPSRGPPHGDRALALPLDPGGTSMADEILYAVADSVATITLNRPGDAATRSAPRLMER